MPESKMAPEPGLLLQRRYRLPSEQGLPELQSSYPP
jgi:hypothetical protein